METEKKTKNQSSKSFTNDSVTHTLKYDSAQKAPISSSSRSPLHSSKADNKSNVKDHHHCSSEERAEDGLNDISPRNLKNTFQNTPTKLGTKNIYGEDTNVSRGNPNNLLTDSPFTSFCKGLDLSPGVVNARSPINIKSVPFSLHSGLKSFMSPLPLLSSMVKEGTSSSPFNKHIAKLNVKNKFVSIEAKKEQINIRFDKFRSFQDDDEEDNPKYFERASIGFSLQDGEDTQESPKFSFGTKKSVYNSNALVPMHARTFSFRPDESANVKQEYFQAEERLSDRMLNMNHDYEHGEKNHISQIKLETIFNEAPSTPTLYQEAKKKIRLLDSMNSFSGKKSHEERQRSKMEIAFGSDPNSNSSNDSFVKKHFEGSAEQESKEPVKKLTCNCKKSKCLKLYCDCFAADGYCSKDCNCSNCQNTEEYEEERQKAKETTLERNPDAFKAKINVLAGEQVATKVVEAINTDKNAAIRHAKGCNCKKSGCLKKYCECYQAGIKCSELCKCEGCKNCDKDSLLKRARSIGLLGSQDIITMKTENSHLYDLNGHRGPFGRYKEHYNRDLDDIFQEVNEEEIGEEDSKHFGPRKKLNLGNFNTFTNDLLDDVINPVGDEKPMEKIEVEEENEKKENKEAVEEPVNISETVKRKKKGKNDPVEEKEQIEKTKPESKRTASKRKKN